MCLDRGLSEANPAKRSHQSSGAEQAERSHKHCTKQQQQQPVLCTTTSWTQRLPSATIDIILSEPRLPIDGQTSNKQWSTREERKLERQAVAWHGLSQPKWDSPAEGSNQGVAAEHKQQVDAANVGQEPAPVAQFVPLWVFQSTEQPLSP